MADSKKSGNPIKPFRNSRKKINTEEITKPSKTPSLSKQPTATKQKPKKTKLKDPLPIDEQLLKHLKNNYSRPMSFDNTGILVPYIGPNNYSKIVLTIDLSKKVIQKYNHKNIVYLSYHPPLFKPFKRIDKSMKELITQACIVSPHTMLDPEMNLRLSFLACGFDITDEIESYRLLYTNPSMCFEVNKLKHTIVNEEMTDATACYLENSGGLSVDQIAKNVKEALGLKKLDVYPSFSHARNAVLNSVVVGVGATRICVDDVRSMFTTKKIFHNLNKIKEIKNCVVIVGEMRHHEILKLQESNTIFVAGHAQSERFFLKYLYEDLVREGFQRVEIAKEKEHFTVL